MTEDQFKTLCARAYLDGEFREELLKNPQETAARLGITLKPGEADHIRNGAAATRAAGASADKNLGRNQPFTIPFPPLRPEPK